MRGQHLGDEVAEHHGLTVGDEVDPAGRTPLRREHEALHRVVHVGRGGEVLAAAYPRELARLDGLHQARQQGAVAGAPHEARPHAHGLEPIAVRVADELFGLRLGGAVGRLRVRPQRRGLVHVHERVAGEQHGLGTHVHEPPHASRAAGLDHVGGAAHVHLVELPAGPPFPNLGRGMEGQFALGGRGRERLEIG